MKITPTSLLSLQESLFDEASEIIQKKNHDYTGGDGDVFRNFRASESLGIHPVKGMILRQMDKIQRVNTFLEKGELKVNGEGLRDAIVDQINYLVLQYAYLVEQSTVEE